MWVMSLVVDKSVTNRINRNASKFLCLSESEFPMWSETENALVSTGRTLLSLQCHKVVVHDIRCREQDEKMIKKQY